MHVPDSLDHIPDAATDIRFNEITAQVGNIAAGLHVDNEQLEVPLASDLSIGAENKSTLGPVPPVSQGCGL